MLAVDLITELGPKPVIEGIKSDDARPPRGPEDVSDAVDMALIDGPQELSGGW